MAIFATLLARLGFDTSQWTSGTQKARSELKQTEAQAKKSFKSIVSELNSSFGKKSMLGQSLKLAAGGGAIAALGKAGGELKDFLAGINDMNQAFHRGEIGAGEYAEKVAGSIPVFGKFWGVGREIREMITGQNAALKANEAAIAAVVKMHELAYQKSDKWRDETKSLTEELQKQKHEMENSTVLAGIEDDTDRSIEEVFQQAKDKTDELNEKVKKDIHQDQIDGIKAELDRLGNVTTTQKNYKQILGQMDALRFELQRLNADKKRLLDEQAQYEVTLTENTQARVDEIVRKRNEVTAAEAAKVAQKAADAEAEDEEKRRHAVLEQMQHNFDKQVKDLELERKKLLGEKEEKYQAPSSAAVRGRRAVVGREFKMADRMQRLSEDQLKRLESIDAQLTKLTGQPPEDVANF